MKSIMEEASTIAKAIEKAWMQAGQPKDFSVKVFEEPQHNFIGMTVRSAKIGIFFNEPQSQKSESQSSKYKPKSATPAQQPQQRERREPRAAQPQASAPVESKPKERKPLQPRAPRQPESLAQNTAVDQTQPSETEQARPTTPVWSDSMVTDVQQWLAQTLSLMHKPEVQFSIEPSHFHLKINFAHPIFEDKNREKQFFASLATLYLQMLKQRYRRPLKGYKIILIGA